MLFYHCFILLSVLSIAKGYSCHTAAPGQRGYSQHCKREFGCVMVKYLADVRQYQTRDKARYMCVENIAHLHPLFAVVNCPHSNYRATCYDVFSTEKIDFNVANGLQLDVEKIGDILKMHGIEKYCCCKGNECNKVNGDMVDYFNPRPSTFQETLDIPDAEFYPGGIIVNSDQTRWHQSSASQLYPYLSLLLFLTFYFAF